MLQHGPKVFTLGLACLIGFLALAWLQMDTKFLQNQQGVLVESWRNHKLVRLSPNWATRERSETTQGRTLNNNTRGHNEGAQPAKLSSTRYVWPKRTKRTMSQALSDGTNKTICQGISAAHLDKARCVEIRGTHASDLPPVTSGWPFCCSVLLIVEPSADLAQYKGGFFTTDHLVYVTIGNQAYGTHVASTREAQQIRVLFGSAYTGDQGRNERRKHGESNAENSVELQDQDANSHAQTENQTSPGQHRRLLQKEEANSTSKKESVGQIAQTHGAALVFRYPSSYLRDLLPRNSVDVVYVRMRHDYCRAAQDMRNVWEALRIGGVIFGEGYNQSIVNGSVREFDKCGGW
jgi:hypothetical protein